MARPIFTFFPIYEVRSDYRHRNSRRTGSPKPGDPPDYQRTRVQRATRPDPSRIGSADGPAAELVRSRDLRGLRDCARSHPTTRLAHQFDARRSRLFVRCGYLPPRSGWAHPLGLTARRHPRRFGGVAVGVPINGGRPSRIPAQRRPGPGGREANGERIRLLLTTKVTTST